MLKIFSDKLGHGVASLFTGYNTKEIIDLLTKKHGTDFCALEHCHDVKEGIYKFYFITDGLRNNLMCIKKGEWIAYFSRSDEIKCYSDYEFDIKVNNCGRIESLESSPVSASRHLQGNNVTSTGHNL
jgi:hypothetical protein